MINQLEKPIGILGGTFDPIHLGHISIAHHILKQLKPHKILFIPCYQPVHRKKPIASPQQRLKMVKLALEDYKSLEADDREIQRQNTSYTLDTLQSLRQDFPNTPLCLIIGFDEFVNLTTWHAWEKLTDYAHLIIINRPNIAPHLLPLIKKLLKKNETKDLSLLHNTLNGKIYRMEIQPINISATTIRKQLENNQCPKNVLPEKVYEYIKMHQLYK